MALTSQSHGSIINENNCFFSTDQTPRVRLSKLDACYLGLGSIPEDCLDGIAMPGAVEVITLNNAFVLASVTRRVFEIMPKM
jgi:hypothetical protein